MSDFGNGYIRGTAGQIVEVTYRVRRSKAAAYHVIFDRSSTRHIRTFTRSNVDDAVDSFRLDQGTFNLDWSVVALAKSASILVVIAVDGTDRYRRERSYGGSGMTPWGSVTFKMEAGT